MVVILNGTFTFVQEYQAAKMMESFRQLLPLRAKVLREGKIREILASELVVGDIILLEEGNKIPADERLIETNSLKVDHSSITWKQSLSCVLLNALTRRYLSAEIWSFPGYWYKAGIERLSSSERDRTPR